MNPKDQIFPKKHIIISWLTPKFSGFSPEREVCGLQRTGKIEHITNMPTREETDWVISKMNVALSF